MCAAVGFFLIQEEVYAAPECRGVVDYLLQHHELWNLSRLRYNRSDIRKKTAPIIGIPFSRAIDSALQGQRRFQKSMYEIPNWTLYKDKAVIATMVAHTASSEDLVEVEAWQLLDISDETTYVHCIVDKDSKSVLHLDGATIFHTRTQRDEIRNRACKIKGTKYEKHFRIDGK